MPIASALLLNFRLCLLRPPAIRGPCFSSSARIRKEDSGPDTGTTDSGLDASTTDSGLDANTPDSGLDANTPDSGLDADTTDGVPSETKDTPQVVDTTPLYSKEEAEEKPDSSSTGAAGGGNHRKKATPVRSEMLVGREPVAVHDAVYPFQYGKWYSTDPELATFFTLGKSHVPRVPTLAHGLERVLFSPGVHYLQDPSSGVYNFNPYIRNITQPDEFDFDKLTPYITSSQDKELTRLARVNKKRFVGSTSSMTHVLSHLYFAISAGKKPNLSSMSMDFIDMPTSFTRSMRYPASIALRHKDGVYGIDADKSFDVKDSILSVLGKSLEKLLTSTPKEFDKYKKENSWKVTQIPEETYHYMSIDDFVLRSQLDCRDDRLPRRTFDLKTRGSLAVRMDLQNHEVSKGYQIKTERGRMQSFEREYYDMTRSALLKYNMQVRIGNMDGIFVAYHNTARMFGFQYIGRREMDQILYGNEATGSKSFRIILLLLGKMLRTITDQIPGKDIRVTFDSESKYLDMWVEVIDDEKEAIASQQYQETGMYSTNFRQPSSTPKPEARPTDPFIENDPLEPSSAEKVPSEEESLEEALEEDEDVVPSEQIYINTEHPILLFHLETFSTHGDIETDMPVTVKDKHDKWLVNWCLTKSKDSPEVLMQRYRHLRYRQATYFERPSPETPDEKLPPFLRILRRISRRNLWRNEMPKGKVVVNRSRLPTLARPDQTQNPQSTPDAAKKPKTAPKAAKKPKKAAKKAPKKASKKAKAVEQTPDEPKPAAADTVASSPEPSAEQKAESETKH